METLATIAERARSRRLARRRIGFNEKPFDIFLLRADGIRAVGIKSPVRMGNDPAAQPRKCCLVEPTMLFGLSESVRVDGCGYSLFFRPIELAEAEAIFASASEKADLSYPFARLDF